MAFPVPVVDYYQQCEDGLKAYLLTLDELFEHEWQITANDADLKRGADYFILFRPGAFLSAGPSSLNKEYGWIVRATLFSRFDTYENSWPLFKAFRAAILFAIGCNPGLAMNGSSAIPNARAVNLDADGDPSYFQWSETQPKPNFIMQPVRFSIAQRVSFPLLHSSRSTT